MWAVDYDERLSHLWLLYVVGFILHGVADPLITHLIVNVFNVGVELNPLVRPSLQEGAVSFALAYVPLYIIAAAGLVALSALYHRASDADQIKIYRISRVILHLVIVWGALIVTWNLWVLFRELWFGRMV